ncbi:uncharacterized protein TNCV_3479901 [Trichonephila clavipes]|nr:uncharacterized protein TNCV_3479901 [Trichonephila clavipes]
MSSFFACDATDVVKQAFSSFDPGLCTLPVTDVHRYCRTSTESIEKNLILLSLKRLENICDQCNAGRARKNGLDIQNCRGQGYNNGANIVGVNSGVKTRILNINPTVFFTPYNCHSWNLLLVDADN